MSFLVCLRPLMVQYHLTRLEQVLKPLGQTTSMARSLSSFLISLWAILPFYIQYVGAGQARILIYSATRDFRHDSIPTAIQALKTKQDIVKVQFDATEDETQFTDNILSLYDTILFLSTTGEVLDSNGKEAFQKYLDLGGTFVGIHSASDTLRNTTFYMQELGSRFDYHPVLQNFTADVLDSTHPSTSALPTEWHVQDEAYNFLFDPRQFGAVVLLAANESSYVDNGVRHGNQGTPHPLAWFQEKGAGVESSGFAGRSFYTSLGHLNETWEDDLFLSHVLGGISWVLQGNTTRAFNSSALVGNQVAGNMESTNSSNGTTATTPPSSSSAGNHPQTSQQSKTYSIEQILPVFCAVGALVLGPLALLF